MVDRPEVLAIVQARGGSKGLPRKNVLPLGGHPLVAYSIASGLASESITRLIVSTDDDEIAAVAERYGAEIPFRRPADLAADDTPDYPLFVHALDWLEREENYRPDVVVQLRPTTPLRPHGLLDEAVRMLLNDPRADCVRGVTIPKQTPYKMWRDAADGYLAAVDGHRFSRALQHAAAKTAGRVLADGPRRRHPRHLHSSKAFPYRRSCSTGVN